MTLKSICLLVLLPLGCFAGEPYVPRIADPVLEPWHWREMEVLGGMGALCMDEADDGVLWFGCIGGLVRYDGLEVQRIPFDDELMSGIESGSHRVPWAQSVLCMRDGRLLAVVESGLVCRKNGQWEVVLRDVGGVSYETRLEQAEDGSVWLLTSEGLWVFREDLSKQQRVLRPDANEQFTSFCRDGQGDVWVVRYFPQQSAELIHIPLQDGTPADRNQWAVYPIATQTPGSESGIAEGPGGRIWYVDNNSQNGVWAFERSTETWEPLEHPESHKGYFSLIRDHSGTLWAGGPGLLFAIRRSGNGYYSPAQLGLPSIPLTIYETAAGKWWVIGRGGYVYAMDPSHDQWMTYVGLHFECDTPDGRQWFLSGNRGVVSDDPATGEWVRYRLSDGLIDWPRSLVASRDGRVWAAGSHKGRAAVAVFDGEKWTRRRHANFALFIEGGGLEAQDGTLWFGAMGTRLAGSPVVPGGALQYTVTPEGKVRLLKHHDSNELPYTISRMAQTPDGTLWLGAPTVYRYDVDTGTAQAVPDLPVVHTHDMDVDQAGNLWIAKGLFGVYRKEKEGWRNFSGKDGLAGKLVVDLLPLQDGTLLAAADTGIDRFDGQNWIGSVLKTDFGMSNRSGNMRQSKDGAVWFNFTNKDVRSPQVMMNIASTDRFCTVRYRADTFPPNTFIEQHLKQVDAAGNLHVAWSGRDAWDDTPADGLQFSWRLDGGEWSPFSYGTSKTFLNLTSGQHALEVRARDRDFNVDSTPARSGFMVALPLWRQAWFVGMILLMAAGAASFLWLLIHFHDKRLKDRARHLTEIDQMKTGFFTNISHELRTPLTLISRPLERLLESEDREEKREMLSMALRNADRVWTLASQLLDFRKLEMGKMQVNGVEGDLTQCVREAVDILQSAALSKQIHCRVVCTGECYGWFDAEKLKKTVQNLVSNAIKYTPVGGEVWVQLEAYMDEDGSEMMRLVVEDTGPGIDPAHLSRIFDRFYRIPEKTIVDGSGIGLNLAKELVELLGGSIRAESPVHPDQINPGARFVVCLPIGRNKFRGVLSAGERA